jgi:hypothetical protein
MRRLILVGLVLLTGCQGIVGPRQRLFAPKDVDVPGMPIPEQERRGREFLALPEPSNDVAPRTYAENPAYKGRIAQ